MKILYWTELYPPDIGGAEILSASLLQELRARGHECRVITCHGRHELPDLQEQDGIPVSRFWFQRGLLRQDLRALRALQARVDRQIRDFQPDLIHLSTCQPSLYFYLKSRVTRGYPAIATLCDPPGESLCANSLLGRTLKQVQGVFPMSRAVETALLAKLPEIQDKVQVIYIHLTPPDEKPASLPTLPRMLGAGRLVPEKGMDLAIRALASLRREFPGLELTIAGDGVARAELEGLSSELGLTEAVRFTGWVDPSKMPALINAHSLVVVPSRWQEPFGLIALQAAQMQRPCVVANRGGLPEVTLHEETGLVFSPEDAGDLVFQIRRLLSDPELARRLGKNGYRRARDFSMGHVAEAYEAVYRSIHEIT